MRSDLFEQGNLEQQSTDRFVLQNSQMLRVSLGPDVLATKGSMVAFQGQVRFDHEKTGGLAKLAKKIMTSEDVSLMRVSGQGEVFFADQAGYVYLLQLENEAISINSRNLMAFDASLAWDINRTKGAGMASGGALTIIDRASGAVIGSSRYDNWKPETDEIEIGWTYLARAYWGETYNREIKRLMLDHIHRFVGTAVFSVGEGNIRSRKAMAKIGGVLRPGIELREMAGEMKPHVVFEIRRP